MSEQKETTPTPVRIDGDQYQELMKIKDAWGIPVAEQVRRAIDLWLAHYQDVLKLVYVKEEAE
jgi:hypothetical protein